LNFYDEELFCWGCGALYGGGQINLSYIVLTRMAIDTVCWKNE
jgi:hypothetical protein